MIVNGYFRTLLNDDLNGMEDFRILYVDEIIEEDIDIG
jgi:hypothetical protein